MRAGRLRPASLFGGGHPSLNQLQEADLYREDGWFYGDRFAEWMVAWEMTMA